MKKIIIIAIICIGLAMISWPFGIAIYNKSNQNLKTAEIRSLLIGRWKFSHGDFNGSQKHKEIDLMQGQIFDFSSISYRTNKSKWYSLPNAYLINQSQVGGQFFYSFVGAQSNRNSFRILLLNDKELSGGWVSQPDEMPKPVFYFKKMN